MGDDFDPDAYLADGGEPFDPDAYLAEAPPASTPAEEPGIGQKIRAGISGALKSVPFVNDLSGMILQGQGLSHDTKTGKTVHNFGKEGFPDNPADAAIDRGKMTDDFHATQGQLAKDEPWSEGLGQGTGAIGTSVLLPGGKIASGLYGASLGAGQGDDLKSRVIGGLAGGTAGLIGGAVAGKFPRAALPIAVGLGTGTAAFGDKLGLSKADRIGAGFATLPAAVSMLAGLPRFRMAQGRDAAISEAQAEAKLRGEGAFNDVFNAGNDAAVLDAKNAEAQALAKQQGEGAFKDLYNAGNDAAVLDAKNRRKIATAEAWKKYQAAQPPPFEQKPPELADLEPEIKGDMGTRAQAMQQVAQTTDALGLPVDEDVKQGLLVAGQNHLKNKTPEALEFAKGMENVRAGSEKTVMERAMADYENAKAAAMAKLAEKQAPKRSTYTDADQLEYVAKRNKLGDKQGEAARTMSDSSAREKENLVDYLAKRNKLGDKQGAAAKEWSAAQAMEKPENILAEGKKQVGPVAAVRGGLRMLGFGKGPIGMAANAASEQMRGATSPEMRAYMLNRPYAGGSSSLGERLNSFERNSSAVNKDLSRLSPTALEKLLEKLKDKEE